MQMGLFPIVSFLTAGQNKGCTGITCIPNKYCPSIPPQICSTLTISEAQVLFYQNIFMPSHELCIQILTFHYCQCDFHTWSHQNLK